MSMCDQRLALEIFEFHGAWTRNVVLTTGDLVKRDATRHSAIGQQARLHEAALRDAQRKIVQCCCNVREDLGLVSGERTWCSESTASKLCKLAQAGQLLALPTNITKRAHVLSMSALGNKDFRKFIDESRSAASEPKKHQQQNKAKKKKKPATAPNKQDAAEEDGPKYRRVFLQLSCCVAPSVLLQNQAAASSMPACIEHPIC